MLPEIAARLRAEVSALKGVRGAAASERPLPLAGCPQAFVVPLAEHAEPNSRVNEVSQGVEIQFGLVLAVAGAAGRRPDHPDRHHTLAGGR